MLNADIEHATDKILEISHFSKVGPYAVEERVSDLYRLLIPICYEHLRCSASRSTGAFYEAIQLILSGKMTIVTIEELISNQFKLSHLYCGVNGYRGSSSGMFHKRFA